MGVHVLCPDIDDLQLFTESGLMKHLKPFDFVSIDPGLTERALKSSSCGTEHPFLKQETSQCCRQIGNLLFRQESMF